MSLLNDRTNKKVHKSQWDKLIVLIVYFTLLANVCVAGAAISNGVTDDWNWALALLTSTNLYVIYRVSIEDTNWWRDH